MSALGDLKKLISYKVKKGISDRWILTAVGYYIAFQRCVDIARLEAELNMLICRYDLDGRIDLESIPKKSVRASNDVIINDLGITPRMADILKLDTLRKDAHRVRKLRWNRNDDRVPRSLYLSRFKTENKARKIEIERLMEKGMDKSAIARELGISRQTVYNILKVGGELKDNEEAI
ncbi:helix-turn-helix domain-containing protein [Bacillus sp. S0628]|uniref:helix-turn-helix domain-containing protein n=1 Tax=Bacillus sp. S0628 TaxID=2957802 RepID=UPI00209DC1ED|nr:helix-turn-helix domain-containing protein [Bacillus sp. S0628]